MDEEQSQAAVEQVGSWRKNDYLPFPGPTEKSIERWANTLDYPPRGSAQDRDSELDIHKAAEPLSTDADTEEADDKESAVGPERK